MYTLSKLFLVALLFTIVCAHHHDRHRHHYRAAVHRLSTNRTYVIQDLYQGEDFFNYWDFFTGTDPVAGDVVYQSLSDAQSKGLAYVDGCDNSTVFAADSISTVTAGGKRGSVRITSQKSYNGGLFVIDASNIPVGCSTWPGFWTVGPDWPWRMTLRNGTNETCTIEGLVGNSTFTVQAVRSNWHTTETSESGCGIEDTDIRSFGYDFNSAQGGVFAFLWDNMTGMSMWHFARADIPADLTARQPNPFTWGTPIGFWSAQSCNVLEIFYDHQMVIDTAHCGNRAGGGSYSKSGCPVTYTDMNAKATNFVDAKWVINYVAVFQ